MAKQYPTRKRTGKKRTLVIVIAVILLFGTIGGIVVVQKMRAKKPVSNTTPANMVDLSPATPEEKQDSNQHKEDTAKGGTDTDATTSPSGQSTTSGKKSVSVIIVSVGQTGTQVEVRSYVSGVIEEGGMCTATFTKGQLKLSRQSAGAQDATTTVCGWITVPTAEFPEKGAWSVKVDYTSPTTVGTSSSANIGLN